MASRADPLWWQLQYLKTFPIFPHWRAVWGTLTSQMMRWVRYLRVSKDLDESKKERAAKSQCVTEFGTYALRNVFKNYVFWAGLCSPTCEDWHVILYLKQSKMKMWLDFCIQVSAGLHQACILQHLLVEHTWRLSRLQWQKMTMMRMMVVVMTTNARKTYDI